MGDQPLARLFAATPSGAAGPDAQGRKNSDRISCGVEGIAQPHPRARGQECAVGEVVEGGVRYLARLLSRVKYPKVKKRIEAALNEAAAKAGITRGELDELSIPTHDLDARGAAEIAIGDGAAQLAISGTTSVEVTWRAAN